MVNKDRIGHVAFARIVKHLYNNSNNKENAHSRSYVLNSPKPSLDSFYIFLTNKWLFLQEKRCPGEV